VGLAKTVGGAFLPLLALACPAKAFAADGPGEYMKDLWRQNPAVVIVGSITVFGADLTAIIAASITASRRQPPDSSFLWTELVLATPQAIGFGLAPFLYDTEKWTPLERDVLFLPLQTLTGALAVHASWSLAAGNSGIGTTGAMTPAARLGVSFLIGANYAFTANALGTATVWVKWAPLDFAVTEIVYGGAETAFAIERAVVDKVHRAEWGTLSGWAAVICGHGIASAIGDADDHSPKSEARRRAPTAVAPWIVPAAGGVSAGVVGRF